MTTGPAEDMKKRYYCLAEGFTDKFERDLNKKKKIELDHTQVRCKEKLNLSLL